ncbi:hypothetical protein ATCC90586_006646 [Pythium insidiosum]|nr:hypothetical protein ATCC90586_006646 [Pythium insidiosum]
MEGMLNYFIPEDGDTSDHMNVVPLPRVDQLKLQHIKKSFPLPGDFHFRFKTAFEGTYVWLDVTNDADPVPDYNGLIVSKIARVQRESSTRPPERVEAKATTAPKAAPAPDLIETSSPPPPKREEASAPAKAFNDDLVGLLADPMPTTAPQPSQAAPAPQPSPQGPGGFGGPGFNAMGAPGVGSPMAHRPNASMNISQMGQHMGMNAAPGGNPGNSFSGLQWQGMGGPQQQQQQQQPRPGMGMNPGKFHCVTVSRDVFEVRSNYVNLRPVGGGSYGIVCSAEDTLRGRKVAIKKITDVFDDLTDAKRILREMKLLRHLGAHENIINILDVILIPPNVIDFSDIYIVTDLMESDLERIISSSQPLSDAHFQYFLYQILRGMKYIHSANVLHRDLKPSNLLVNSNCDLSICDFGLARGVEMAHNEDLTEYVVTRWYRAPELLADCQNYNDAVDMWAIGCIFAEMLRRRPFFTGRDPSDQLHMIIRVLGSPTPEEMSFVPHEAAKKAILQHGYYPKRPLSEFFPDANPMAVDLLAKMLKFNPEERITVVQALAHPYLAQLHNPADEPVCGEAFNFDFERESLDLGVEMPKDELQRLIYREAITLQQQQQQMGAQQMH